MKPNALKWIISNSEKKNLYVIILVILESINGASGVFYALFLRNIVDAATNKDQNLFFRSVVEIVALVLFQIMLRAVIRWLKEYAKATFENLFKQRLFHSLSRKDYLSVSAVHSGEWLNRLTNDCSVVANHYSEIAPGLSEMVVKLVSALIMILILEPRFALFLIPMGLGLFLFSSLFRVKMKNLHKDTQAADGRLRIFLQESLASLLMIHSFVREDASEAEAKAKMGAHKTARMKKCNFTVFCSVGFALCINALYLFGVGWCGYGILHGFITFGTLTAITQLISQIQSPLLNFTVYIPRYYTMTASAERLMEIEKLEDAFETAPESVETVRALYQNDFEGFGLNNVSFVYFPPTNTAEDLSKEGESPAIHDLSLEIRKGEYVAFTGSSGCGKSTALKLLTCVYAPDGGDRYYLKKDGTREDLTSKWRRLFAYVPQGNHLMSGTVRDVVCFSGSMNSDASSGEGNGASPDNAASVEARLQEALKIACADEFISQLPEGAETTLGERGTGLSEGQMQRLAIARAIFSGAPILLLDESTSALDSVTERNVLQNLKSLTDRTVVIVTHRPAALDFCDRVIEFASPDAD